MKTHQVLILAGAILGAAWILKPVPVDQVSQVELQRREQQERDWRELVDTDNAKRCAVAVGKTLETLDRSDPAQEAPYRKCMWPEESHGRLRRAWNKIRALVW